MRSTTKLPFVIGHFNAMLIGPVLSSKVVVVNLLIALTQNLRALKAAMIVAFFPPLKQTEAFE